jgi:hypothetical protein
MARFVKVAVLLAVVLGVSAIAESLRAESEKAKRPEKAVQAEPVDVPEGMMAIVHRSGHFYTLVPGTPDDLVLAGDRTRIIRSRNPRGAQILGAARNAAVTAMTEVLPLKDCEGGLECGQLFIISVNPLHYACYPVGCSNCSYWHEVCTGN